MKSLLTTQERLLRLLILPVAMVIMVTACGDDATTPVTPPINDNDKNLAETLASESDYSVLASLVTDDLLDVLRNEELTVFAPTNAAFSAIPEEVLESLTTDQVEIIITYHVIEGTTLSSQVPEQADLETVLGELLLIQSNGGVIINGSSDVVEADITASNGVIHGINEVLLPSEIRKALDMHNIIDQAEETGGFETFIEAADATGLTTTLQFLSPFTIFAPTDNAFDALPEGTLESLDTEQLRGILLYHTLGAEVPSAALEATQTPAALTGEALYITANEDGVFVNGRASVVSPDVTASNGIIHVLDEVLIPNSLLNIVQIAQKNYELTTLVELVMEYDLVDTLSGEGPFTLFAPTNSAFDEISEVLPTLSEEEVIDILTYHVVSDEIFSGDIPEGTTMVGTLLEGEELTVVNDGESVTVDGANVITVDLGGINGVIHIVDSVLIPEDEE